MHSPSATSKPAAPQAAGSSAISSSSMLGTRGTLPRALPRELGLPRALPRELGLPRRYCASLVLPGADVLGALSGVVLSGTVVVSGIGSGAPDSWTGGSTAFT